MAKRRNVDMDLSVPIADLAAELKADFKKAFKDDSLTSFQDITEDVVDTWYSTGILTLDAALGGGLAGGQCSMMGGEKSTGKSTTSYSAVAANLQLFPDKIHVIADPENSAIAAREHMIKLGVDVEAPNLLIISKPEGKPLYAEDMFERLEALFRNPKLQGRLGLIVIDSIGAIISKHEGEKTDKYDKAPRVGGLIQTINMFLRGVHGSGLLYESGAHILFLSQVRDNIGDMWNPFKMNGGRMLEHAVVQIIFTSRSKGQDFSNKNYKEGNPLEARHVGQRIKYQITKNKVGGKEGATAAVDYYYEEGLDIYANTIEFAEFLGLMSGGGWKSLINPATGEVIARYQGLNRWKEALHSNEKLWSILYLMTTLGYKGTDAEEMMAQVIEQVGDLDVSETSEPTKD